ncbi:hypothetical protein BJX61DRAFT_492059 [Aspergillus egyptiacus]|nr:hypothetical protein BJX61DRAFT_492059 [Aspergillus egyptiacus]
MRVGADKGARPGFCILVGSTYQLLTCLYIINWELWHAHMIVFWRGEIFLRLFNHLIPAQHLYNVYTFSPESVGAACIRDKKCGEGGG